MFYFVGVSDADKALIIDEHNRVRSEVDASASNMQKAVRETCYWLVNTTYLYVDDDGQTLKQHLYSLLSGK